MYHLIGIKELDMMALARVIHTLGYKVDGSDISDQNDKEIQIKAFNENNIEEDMIIIKGDNIPDDNVELLKAEELGLKIYSYSQMKKRFIEMFSSITISGCTGKSITTELMANVLSQIMGCNYLLNDGRGYASKANEYFCLEVNENQDNFLEINPYYSIITNIDLNYTNKFNNIDEVILAYQTFAENTEKMVLANGDDRYTRLFNINTPIFYYGLNDDNDIIAKEVEYSEQGTSFEVHVEDNYYGNFELPIYGKSMLLNVLSVIGICYYERIDVKFVNKALKEYFANKNLFNEQQFKDLITINYNINHPREIKSLIRALEQKYPMNELVSIITAKDLFNNEELNEHYIRALNLSDKVYVISNEEDDNSLKALDSRHYSKLSDINKLTKEKQAILIFLSKQKENSYQKEFENIIKNKK